MKKFMLLTLLLAFGVSAAQPDFSNNQAGLCVALYESKAELSPQEYEALNKLKQALFDKAGADVAHRMISQADAQVQELTESKPDELKSLESRCEFAMISAKQGF